MELLLRMWDAPKRGMLEYTEDQFCRLIGCECPAFVRALSEIKALNIAEVSQNGHGVITVTNRRMRREQIEREQATERKRRERERKSESRKCHGDDTEKSRPLSSSSSSSSCPKGHNISSASADHILTRDVAKIWTAWCQHKNLIHHRELTDTHKKRIQAKLKVYSTEEICGSIANYSAILADPEYLMEYKWKLDEFMVRGCEKFMAENHPFDSYPKVSRKPQGPTPTCATCGRWDKGYCTDRKEETEPDSRCKKWLQTMKGITPEV